MSGIGSTLSVITPFWETTHWYLRFYRSWRCWWLWIGSCYNKVKTRDKGLWGYITSFLHEITRMKSMDNFCEFRQFEWFCLTPNIIVIVTSASSLPNPSSNYYTISAVEVLRYIICCSNMFIHRHSRFRSGPGINSGVAWHKVTASIVHGTVQVCPVSFVVDCFITWNLEPCLSSMICSDLGSKGDVFSWSEDWNGDLSFVVIILPDF